MQHLRELQPSQLEQQSNSGGENQPEHDSESDDGLNDGRAREYRCIAPCCSNLPLCSSCNLTGPCIQKDKIDEDDGDAEIERRLGPELSLQCILLLTGSMKGSLSPTTF